MCYREGQDQVGLFIVCIWAARQLNENIIQTVKSLKDIISKNQHIKHRNTSKKRHGQKWTPTSPQRPYRKGEREGGQTQYKGQNTNEEETKRKQRLQIKIEINTGLQKLQTHTDINNFCNYKKK